MKILVCLSKTPDTTSKISFKENNTLYDENGVQFILNPYDEWYALIKAIELKEQNISTDVHLIFVGLSDYDPIIRKALALGGDVAYRVNSNPTDSNDVAFQIAQFAKTMQYDLILTGKETIDFNSGAVSGLLASMLTIPDISLATSLNVVDNYIVVEREIEGGSEIIKIPTPVLISCQKGMAEQRIPNMRNIMAARTKTLQVIEPAPYTPKTKNIHFQLQTPKSGVKIIDPNNINELVDLLHTEAKVI